MLAKLSMFIGLFEEKLLEDISTSSILRVYLKIIFREDKDLLDKVFNNVI